MIVTSKLLIIIYFCAMFINSCFRTSFLVLLFISVFTSCKKEDAPASLNNTIEVSFSNQTIDFAGVDSVVVFFDKANTATVKQKMMTSANKFVTTIPSLPVGEYDVTIRLYTKLLADGSSRLHIYKKKVAFPVNNYTIAAPSGKLMDENWRSNVVLRETMRDVVFIMAERQDDPFFEVQLSEESKAVMNYVYVDRFALNNGSVVWSDAIELFTPKDLFINGIYTGITEFASYANTMKTTFWTHGEYSLYIEFNNDFNDGIYIAYGVPNRP